MGLNLQRKGAKQALYWGQDSKHFGGSLQVFLYTSIKNQGVSQNMWRILQLFKYNFSCSFERLNFSTMSEENSFSSTKKKLLFLKECCLNLTFFSYLCRQLSNTSVLRNTMLNPGIAISEQETAIRRRAAWLSQTGPEKTLERIRAKPCSGEQASWTRVELISLKSPDCNLKSKITLHSS